MFKKIYLVKLAIGFMITANFSFSISAQNFNLMPPSTRMVNQQMQPAGDGISIVNYQFQSYQSQKEILKFYRTMFANQGFKPMRPLKGQTKHVYYFSKESENKIGIINFLRFIDSGITSYSVTLHEFDPEGLTEWSVEEGP